MRSMDLQEIYNSAIEAGQNRDYHSAVKLLTHVVSQTDGFPQALLYLGRSYHALGQFDKAVQVVLASERASVSLLQRRLSIPFDRAGRLIEMMAESGVVSANRGSQAREILITAAEWKAIQKQTARDAADGFADLQDEDDEGVPATIDNQDIRD